MVLPNTWYTQCSGDDSSPCHAANRTCMVKRYHPPICHPDRNEMEWRDLRKLQILPCVGYFCNLSGFLHSADATVGMTYLGGGSVYPHRLFLPRPRNGTQAVPYVFAGGWIPFNRTGCIRNVAGGRLPPLQTLSLSSAQILFGTPPERHTGRSLRLR